MKKIFKISLIYTLFCINNSFAQIIPLESPSWDGSFLNGNYYKDTNNVLNMFEGTWVYNSNNTYFKIILVKKHNQSISGLYHEDLIIGELQFNYFGIEIYNSLDKINQNYQNIYSHTIDGNFILNSPFLLNCTDCELNEKRLYLGFSVNVPGFIILKKTIINGQEALKVYVQNEYDETQQPLVPTGWYNLLKQ
jgi:hypothetical protein